MDKKIFAVVQYGMAIYGFGETREQAIREAAHWLGDPQGSATVKAVEKLLDHGNGDRVHGEFYVISDPEEIAEYTESDR